MGRTKRIEESMFLTELDDLEQLTRPNLTQSTSKAQRLYAPLRVQYKSKALQNIVKKTSKSHQALLLKLEKTSTKFNPPADIYGVDPMRVSGQRTRVSLPYLQPRSVSSSRNDGQKNLGTHERVSFISSQDFSISDSKSKTKTQRSVYTSKVSIK